jgi:hypothetical protein
MSLFAIGILIPSVPPLVTEHALVFGEHFRGQSGAGYNNVYGQKIALGLEFPRLTRDEADILRMYCKASGNSIYADFVVSDRERIFDGVTTNAQEGRILNRMKVTAWEFSAIKSDSDPDDMDNGTIQTASLTIEEI